MFEDHPHYPHTERRSLESRERMICDEAADLAVCKVFAVLGVDINQPKDIEQFREDLRFSAHLRRAADKGVMAGVTALVGALALALWVAVVSKFNGG